MKKTTKLLKIFSIAVLVLIGNFCAAQTKVIVYQIDGGLNEYFCSDNGKLTFDETNLVIDNGNGNVVNMARSNVRKIVFAEDTSTDVTLIGNIGQVSVFPNPASDFIQITGGIEETFLLTIISVEGKTMLSGQYSVGDKINIGFLPKGMYIAKLNNSRIKIIKN
jgi:hypothetical protein